jgi:anti-sigma factor RsiW
MSDTRALGETMSCSEFVELVTDYLEGRLEAAEAERFEAHLALCDGCQAYVAQMRVTWRRSGGSRRRRSPPRPAPSSSTCSRSSARARAPADRYFNFSVLTIPAWSES